MSSKSHEATVEQLESLISSITERHNKVREALVEKNLDVKMLKEFMTDKELSSIGIVTSTTAYASPSATPPRFSTPMASAFSTPVAKKKKGPVVNARDHEVSEATKKIAGGVDLCFMMDCTGSMHSWINEVKIKMNEILENLKTQVTSITSIRIAFIGYHDFDVLERGGANIVTKNFVEGNIDEMISFISELEVDGGGDCAEDIVGAWHDAAHVLDWRLGNKVILHFTDAPGHGREYCESKYDNYGTDDAIPLERSKVKYATGYLNKLVEKSVAYTFIKIGHRTDHLDMTGARIAERYKNVSRVKYQEVSMAEVDNNFVVKVVSSIKSSIRA